MRVQFQNHASLLIEHDAGFLLTDPWFNQPAFGSWLPTFPPYVHPTYLAALGSQLSILISHGHDDHFDDRCLTIFHRDTEFVTAAFSAPSVVNRLKRLGFENVVTVGEEEIHHRGLLISSLIVPELSHDDAVYLIRDTSGAIVHANDVWQPFQEGHLSLLRERLSQYNSKSILVFSQTNSAAGYPLNYRNFSRDEQRELLEQKIAGMVRGGLENAWALGCDRLFSYAGFATVFVRGKDYHQRGFLPTANNVRQLLDRQDVASEVTIADFLPGDAVELPSGEISKALVTGYSEDGVRGASQRFYEVYGSIDECLSYRAPSSWSEGIDWTSWLQTFLIEFDSFSRRRVSGPDRHHSGLLGKTFSIEVSDPSGPAMRMTIEFGSGLVEWSERANKICFVDAGVMELVLRGDALFEDLSTGYLAEWERNPPNIYNRDITMMMTMFSYVYKNRLAGELVNQYLAQAPSTGVRMARGKQGLLDERVSGSEGGGAKRL